MRPVLRALLISPLVAVAVSVFAAGGVHAVAETPVPEATATPGEPEPSSTPPICLPPVCPTFGPSPTPPPPSPTKTHTATSTPTPRPTHTRTRTPRPHVVTSAPDVALPTGAPLPTDEVTDEATPTPSAESVASTGKGSDPALRAVQAAVGLALLLGLLGGFGLYYTREHQ